MLAELDGAINAYHVGHPLNLFLNEEGILRESIIECNRVSRLPHASIAVSTHCFLNVL